MDVSPRLAIIGGSGLYKIPGLQDARQLELETPFGKPSSPIMVGYLSGQPVAFLARHGIGHFISPTEVNYRANIFALKMLGIERIVSISACGSLREDYAPGHIVVPDGLFDLTRQRRNSFFEGGMVAHISVADPFCPHLSQLIANSLEGSEATVHHSGTLVTVEGPRFSTRAESNVYRSWGMSLIGMTTSPEAFLAREAEICYAVMAHVTDYDVWHVSEQPVTVDMVIQVLNHNTALAQQAITNLVERLPADRPCECSQALSAALISNPEIIPASTRQRLSLLVDKYLK